MSRRGAPLPRGGPDELALTVGEVGTQTSFCFMPPMINPVTPPATPKVLAHGMTLSPKSKPSLIRPFPESGVAPI